MAPVLAGHRARAQVFASFLPNFSRTCRTASRRPLPRMPAKPRSRSMRMQGMPRGSSCRRSTLKPGAYGAAHTTFASTIVVSPRVLGSPHEREMNIASGIAGSFGWGTGVFRCLTYESYSLGGMNSRFDLQHFCQENQWKAES